MDASVTIQPQLPAGSSISYRGGVVPFGYLLEDGAEVSKTLYARLYEAIGDTYGTPSNPANFKLPDSRGRTDIGSGTGSSLSARTLAQTGGAETHTLTTAEMPAHSHGVNDPGHAHAVGAGTTVDGWGGQFANSGNSVTPHATSVNGTGISIQNNGGGAAHNNMQPYLVATKLIKF